MASRFPLKKGGQGGCYFVNRFASLTNAFGLWNFDLQIPWAKAIAGPSVVPYLG